MSFWKKIFGIKNENDKAQFPFEKYRNELDLKTKSDLRYLVTSIIKPATKLEILAASRPPENSQLNSHFGGQPYFEKGEIWPTTKNGKSLEFIFQVFNSKDLQLPKSIEIIQFYYDWDEFPWDTSNDGWLVKIYKTVQRENLELIDKPSELAKSKYCDVTFKSTNSLPDWEGIDLHCNDASKLSCILEQDKPWENYDQIVTELIGEQDYQSQLGGYPKWVQGESTPKDSKGDSMKLLFQIDSEDNAGLMWGDVGLIYVFYDEEYEKVEFTLQCH